MKYISKLLLLYICIIISGCTNTDNKIPTVTQTFAVTYALSNTHIKTPSLTPTVTNTTVFISTYTSLHTFTSAIENTASKTRSPSDRFIETNDLIPFSYIPPEGWIEDNSGRLTSWIFGEGLRPDTNGCNFSFGVLYQPNTSATNFSIRYRGGEVLGSGKFVTYAGYDAYRLSIRMRATSGDAEMTYYFITNGEYFIIAGYDRLYSTFVEQDIIVDKSVMTVRFEK